MRIILAFAGTAHNMVGRYGHLYLEISKAECELTGTGKLVVLPALVIAVPAETWIPLGHGIIIIPVFGKMFIAATGTAKTDKISAIGDLIIPVTFKNEFLAGLQGRGQHHFHHRFVDGVTEWFAERIGEFGDIHTIPVIRFFFSHRIQHIVGGLLGHPVAGLVTGIVYGAVLVFVQLHPEIRQYIR